MIRLTLDIIMMSPLSFMDMIGEYDLHRVIESLDERVNRREHQVDRETVECVGKVMGYYSDVLSYCRRL